MSANLISGPEESKGSTTPSLSYFDSAKGSFDHPTPASVRRRSPKPYFRSAAEGPTSRSNASTGGKAQSPSLGESLGGCWPKGRRLMGFSVSVFRMRGYGPRSHRLVSVKSLASAIVLPTGILGSVPYGHNADPHHYQHKPYQATLQPTA